MPSDWKADFMGNSPNGGLAVEPPRYSRGGTEGSAPRRRWPPFSAANRVPLSCSFRSSIADVAQDEEPVDPPRVPDEVNIDDEKSNTKLPQLLAVQSRRNYVQDQIKFTKSQKLRPTFFSN